MKAVARNQTELTKCRNKLRRLNARLDIILTTKTIDSRSLPAIDQRIRKIQREICAAGGRLLDAACIATYHRLVSARRRARNEMLRAQQRAYYATQKRLH